MRTCPTCGAEVRVVCLRCLQGTLRSAPPGRPPKRKRPSSSVVAGVDLAPWLLKFSRLPVLGGADCRLATNPCTLHIRRASAKPQSRLGWASYERHLIHLTAYPGQRASDALETLLHEVVHLSSLELRMHDLHFKTTITQAAYEAFGVDLRDQVDRKVYELDVCISDALDRALSDASPRPPSPRCSA